MQISLISHVERFVVVELDDEEAVTVVPTTGDVVVVEVFEVDRVGEVFFSAEKCPVGIGGQVEVHPTSFSSAQQQLQA